LWSAWWKLYGFPVDPRLYVAFFVHDLGHWNSKLNMDGEEGERHVLWGAQIMSRLFDNIGADGFPRDFYEKKDNNWVIIDKFWYGKWGQFCLLHSRFYAKQINKPFSRLCVADKLACCLEPWWLYLPRVILSGEVWEYMSLAGDKPHSKYKGEPNSKHVQEYLSEGTMRGWQRAMTTYLREWVATHKDGREDTWTPRKIEVVNHGE
jgi:hypothetical protein